MTSPLQGGYSTLFDLERELTLYRVGGAHEERSEAYSSPVLHEGYEAFRCPVCGFATLRARARTDVKTCGWWACDKALGVRLGQNVYREDEASL